MSFLDKVKGLFSGEGGEPGDEGIYLYVKLERSHEVVRLRINPRFELNPNYDRGGYISRKLVIGPRSYKRTDATFYFDENRRLVEWDIPNGELVSEEDWLAQQKEKGET